MLYFASFANGIKYSIFEVFSFSQIDQFRKSLFEEWNLIIKYFWKSISAISILSAHTLEVE